MAKNGDSQPKTRSFGTTDRVNYNSSEFYAGKLYAQYRGENAATKYVENVIAPEHLNQIWCKSSEQMDELPDSSVHLMVTSPPYNVGKDYDDDLSLNEYLGLLQTVFTETYRVLVPGGRAVINIANVGRKPYIPLNSEVTRLMHSIGYLMRGEIIWQKGASSGGSCAWGSWQSASNPVLRDTHEYIMVFSKDLFKRPNPAKRENSITRDEFLEYTKSVWQFNTESAKKVGHPAPFPVELPRRVIQMYTFTGDVVLDPFLGAGTTAIAARECGRMYVGYEVNGEYCNLAQKRLGEHGEKKKGKVDQGLLDLKKQFDRPMTQEEFIEAEKLHRMISHVPYSEMR